MGRKNISAPSAEQIDKAIGDLWLKVLELSTSEEGLNLRPEIGDYINIILPQLRVTYPIFYSPYLIATTYYSALESARRGVSLVYKQLGFDINEFKNLPSWSERVSYEAFDALKSIAYDPVMQKLQKGDVELLDASPQKGFLIKISECGDCWGLPNLKLKMCQYTSGSMAGIWSTMIGEEFGVYEKTCIARGDDGCVFVVQPITNREHYRHINEYLTANPREMYHMEDVIDVIAQHIRNALAGKLKRQKYGGTLHLLDYQMRLLSTMSNYPKRSGVAHYYSGLKFGRALAHFFEDQYKVEEQEILKDALPRFYKRLDFAMVESINPSDNGYIVTLKEVADCAGLPDGLAPHDFLCGELAGIASEVLGQDMVCKNTQCRAGKDKICEFKIMSG